MGEGHSDRQHQGGLNGGLASRDAPPVLIALRRS
jgi:hypothetical protein